MTNDEFLALYEKCQTGKCTAEDIQRLEHYKDEFELKELPWLPEMGDRDEVRTELLNTLRSRITPDDISPRKFPFRWVIAASLLVFLSVGLVVLFNKEQKQVTVADHFAQKTAVKTAITPGSNKAILILANGNMVDLDGSDKGLVSKQGAAEVRKLSKGKLVYNAEPKAKNGSQVAYNTIATPRGGQYQLTLADGTMVWLNAASSLKFPTTFSGKERLVELTGEAYFEVAKNKSMPFKVVANGVNVNVLGTHFNVMAYQDESVVKTTLLEGSVRLEKDEITAMLIPGEQGLIKQGGNAFKVREVKVDDIVAWKNGLFSFENENIRTIMRQVSRWYDVDIDYEGQLSKQNFGGSVSRFKDISYLLKTLELTGTVHFKVNGRRITVMP
ncbi:FecR family protein [uncultured Mucilaginibacter sp.]|uniref:FecR family protein n=1 Tax=uncultured Mucilaginibacter sp. TaxID=797541 RepID=UPI0025EE1FF2|nr:FecR family protein [uncultured Mucilaginibacter sp.]